MEATISKTKLDESKSRDGAKCLLYEARTDARHDFQAEIQLNKALQQINPDTGLAVMAQNDSKVNNFVETKFGKSQIGSFCSYQLAHIEANFQAFVDISSVPRANNRRGGLFTYPRFPLVPTGDFVCRDKLDEPERALMSFLAVDETVINNTESSIRGQFQSQWWKEE